MDRKIFGIIFIILMATSIMFLPTYSKASSDIIVMLDPGHGGTESGAVAGGLVEKELNWKLASRVKEILDKTPGITGILTKEKNETLSRYDRAQRAKNNNADLLVSFHINSNELSNQLSGVEVYVTHNITQKRYYEFSNILGENILENLKNVGVPLFAFKPKTRIGTPDDVYSDGTVADYYGIISWPMHNGIPSILVEHCFINNPSDREKYLNDTMLNKMAEADAEAIIENKELFRREYCGEINTDLKTMEIGTEADGRNYITGEILIAEWMDGIAYVPKDLPEMRIKSIDGSIINDVNLVHNGGLSYSYYRIIDKLDIEKEYYLEVELMTPQNLSIDKTQIVRLAEMAIGKYKDTELKTKNDKLYFSVDRYIGAINTDLKTMYIDINEVGREYIHGNILIAEWIDGIACVPNELPEMTLKSIDGTYSAGMHVSHLGGLNYYYDRVIFNLDTSKEYYIEVKLTGKNNIGPNKVQNANLNVTNKIGEFKEKNIITKNNKIVFKGNEYEGAINTDLKTMYLDINEVGREYIHGNILIAEWIDGVACIPNKLPEMTLKSRDGTYSAGMHVSHEGGLNYYYDRVIFNLDTSKEYYIEVKLTNENNISQNKVQKANVQPNEEVGIFKETTKIVLRNNMMLFEELKNMMLTLKVEPNKKVLTEEINERQEVEKKEKVEEVETTKQLKQEEKEEEIKVTSQLIENNQEQVKENNEITNNVNTIEEKK